MRKEHRHEDRHGVYVELGHGLGQVVQEEDETNEIGDKSCDWLVYRIYDLAGDEIKTVVGK